MRRRKAPERALHEDGACFATPFGRAPNTAPEQEPGSVAMSRMLHGDVGREVAASFKPALSRARSWRASTDKWTMKCTRKFQEPVMADGLTWVWGTALIGVGATLILDLWTLFLRVAFRVPATNYAMVGRWIGNFPRGRWAHASIANAPPVVGEHALGWIAHYAIGILYAGLLVLVGGTGWLHAPTLLPALGVGVATVAAPFFVMQPAMGFGVASSRVSKPDAAKLRSLAAHTVFGLGLYLTALLEVSVL